MKVWELEEGKEYIKGEDVSDSNPWIYKMINKKLHIMIFKSEGFKLSPISLNEVMLFDFTEYAPPTDWSKVEVDTKVLCLCLDGVLVKRHFAKYENGRIYTWSYGTTQFTHDESYDESCGMTKWDLENVKLYTEE